MKIEFRFVIPAGRPPLTLEQRTAAVDAALSYFQMAKVDPAMAWDAVVLECEDAIPTEGDERHAVRRLIDIWNRAEAAAHCAAGLPPDEHMSTMLSPVLGEGQS